MAAVTDQLFQYPGSLRIMGSPNWVVWKSQNPSNSQDPVILRVNRIQKIPIPFPLKKKQDAPHWIKHMCIKITKEKSSTNENQKSNVQNPHDVPMNPGWFIGILIYWLIIIPIINEYING